MKKIVTVVGNRPQFIKAAIVARQWREAGFNKLIANCLVHTGQHYDPMLSDVFFEQLKLPKASHKLEIGSGAILDIIGSLVPKLRAIYEAERPDGILVYGDTNSTIAAALAAGHMHIPLFHVEAGERNYRRFNAPEEINRIITDELSWLCLTSTDKARHYLLREGFAPERVKWVGDPMYDLFVWAREHIKNLQTTTASDLGMKSGKFVLATLHRAENTNNPLRLLDLMTSLDTAHLPVVMPVHPRVKNLLHQADWRPNGSLKLIDPMSYFDIISLLSECSICVTDSGGLSREAFFSEKPTIVPMANSGWNEVVESGWIRVVPGPGSDLLLELQTFRPSSEIPTGLFGNGKASEEIGLQICQFLDQAPAEGCWHPLGDFSSIPQPTDRSNFTFQQLQLMLTHAQSAQTEYAYFVGGNLAGAKQIAEAHNAAGVSATFIVTADGDLYNLLGSEVSCFCRFISEQGQQLALRSISRMSLNELRHLAQALAPVLEFKFDAVYYTNTLITLRDGNKRILEPITDQDFIDRLASNTSEILLGQTDWWNATPMSSFEVMQRIVFKRQEVARSQLTNLFKCG